METIFADAAFVCTAWLADPAEIQRTKDTTPDPIGGIGYNIDTGAGRNASWGSPADPIPLMSVTEPSNRIIFASSYDWYLGWGETRRAYNRFGTNKALAVYWDGHAASVDRETYDAGVRPERR